jgi:hypothetical protein
LKQATIAKNNQSTYVRACHAAHQKAHPGDLPFSCPCCSFVAYNEQDIIDDKAPNKKKDHYEKHEGQGYHGAPLAPIEHQEADECVMHMRHCIAAFIYEHAIMDHIETDGQSLEIQATCKKHKVHMAKSKTTKRKKKDTESDYRKKPSFIGSNDKTVIENLPEFLNIVSPNKIDGAEAKTNKRANKKVIKAAESWCTWRNAVYRPILSRYPTRQVLKRKYDEVQPAAVALFKDLKLAFDNHVTPYMHHMLHSENFLKRDVLDRSGESLEHKNKKIKSHAVFTSHHLPSAANRATAVTHTCLKRQSAMEDAKLIFAHPPTKHELRRQRKQRQMQTVNLVPYSDSDSDS